MIVIFVELCCVFEIRNPDEYIVLDYFSYSCNDKHIVNYFALYSYKDKHILILLICMSKFQDLKISRKSKCTGP